MESLKTQSEYNYMTVFNETIIVTKSQLVSGSFVSHWLTWQEVIKLTIKYSEILNISKMLILKKRKIGFFFKNTGSLFYNK